MAVFTANFVAGLKPGPSIYEERDTGCPGLIIRVGQRGKKVWEVIVSRDGKRRRERLGVFPDVSLAKARRLASEAKSAPEAHSSGMRVRDLWETYRAEVKDRRRAFRDVESVWTMWAEPIIGNVRLEDLSIHHGSQLISAVVKRSSPNRARKAIRNLAPMFRFAAGRGMIPANPWAGLHVPEAAPARDRVLSRDEWARLWQWSNTAGYVWGPFVAVLMLTAQRLNEVASMRWGELEGDVWAIPAARHKSKRRHEVPLSGALVALLATLPRHDDFVFSTRHGRPVAPGSWIKDKISAEADIAVWRFHDVRRSAATFMAEGGVTRFIIERTLGHTETGVTQVYDRHHYREEKRRALDVLAETVGAGDGG